LFIITAPAQNKGQLQNFSKAYNGLYILNDQLHELFPLANIEYSYGNIASSLKDKQFYQSGYFIFVSKFFPATSDLVLLKDFIKEGNQAIIFATAFNSTAMDFFNFQNQIDSRDSSDPISLKRNHLDELGTFTSKRISGYSNYFTRYDSAATIVLGRNESGRPDFIKIIIGSGSLYIHLYPQVLMNYFLMEKNNFAYTEAVFSHLPRNLNNIVIKLAKKEDGGYRGEKDPDLDFMAFIKQNKNLWSAFLLGLFLFGLMILFGFKKRQRTIPVLEPVRNNTLEYTKTIGDLYFNEKNNLDIANKKLLFWQEQLRNRYQIATHLMDHDFWEKLKKKSGAEWELLRKLQATIVNIKTGEPFSDRQLIQFSNQISQFNKI
jgi:hypothetical protein